MTDRYIDVKTSKKLLTNTCNFLKNDDSGLGDFIIPGREAIILSAYTGAFFILDNTYRFSFSPTINPTLIGQDEPLSLYKPTLIPGEESRGLLPILSRPLTRYLELFPDLEAQKHLFLVDTSTKGWFSTEDFLAKIETKGLSSADCLVWVAGNGTYSETHLS